jgi:hypothetical protein
VLPLNDRWEYNVSANTPEANAHKEECKISEGLLTDLFLYFPPGVKNLARCRVFLGEKAVAPRSPKGYYSGHGTLVEITGMKEHITENIPVLNWYVWNLDETYSHNLIMWALWIGQEEEDVRLTLEEIRELNRLLKGMVGL